MNSLQKSHFLQLRIAALRVQQGFKRTGRVELTGIEISRMKRSLELLGKSTAGRAGTPPDQKKIRRYEEFGFEGDEHERFNQAYFFKKSERGTSFCRMAERRAELRGNLIKGSTARYHIMIGEVRESKWA